MQTQFDVEFNFTEQESAQEAATDEILGFWLQEFSELKGRNNRHDYVQPGDTPFILQENTRDTWQKHHTAFLIEQPAELIHRYQQAKELMIYGLGEEAQFFTTVFLGYPSRESHRGMLIGKEGFRQWNDLRPYVTPLTDLVLIDRYIGNDNSLLASNLFSIVRLFHANKQGRTNIILLTDKRELAKGGHSPKSLQKKIKEEIADIPGCTAKVTVVCWSSDTRQNRQQYPEIKRFEEHDRTLVTNYTRWKSGDSFNYFDSQNRRITSGRSMDIFSLAKRDNLAEAQDLLNDINDYLQWCKSSNPDNIVGDRSSRLLNIPR